LELALGPSEVRDALIKAAPGRLVSYSGFGRELCLRPSTVNVTDNGGGLISIYVCNNIFCHRSNDQDVNSDICPNALIRKAKRPRDYRVVRWLHQIATSSSTEPEVAVSRRLTPCSRPRWKVHPKLHTTLHGPPPYRSPTATAGCCAGQGLSDRITRHPHGLVCNSGAHTKSSQAVSHLERRETRAAERRKGTAKSRH
jgi:hypothetical protein